MASYDGFEYEVLIVGSGAGGGMAAHILTEAGIKVLMLEAGRDYDPLEENIYRLRHFDTNGECSDEWYQTFITSQHADLHSIINIQGQQIDRIQTSGVYFLKSESGKTEKRMVIID